MSDARAARLRAAMARASEAVARGPFSAPADGRLRRRRVVVGDPQAETERLLAILDHAGLLGDDGWLKPDVQLVSVGDHFDWGKPHEREPMARSALATVAWLAAHPADQAILLLGNHDLGRVGELAPFTDATFARAQVDADGVYTGKDTDAATERDFLSRWPRVPSAELVARDFGNFREAQRTWVAHLLRVRRFRTAYAAGPGLVVLHAGVTREDLDVTGLSASRHADAEAVAAALNGVVDAAVRAWEDGPLFIPGLHRPGDADYGEGRGIFYHRPSLKPEDAERVGQTPRRRFDPRRLPLGLTQVVGHTRDKRSREMLMQPGPVREGVLRHFVTDGTRTAYAHGTAPTVGASEAALVFTDGGMRECPAEEYQLFDLDTRAAVVPER